MEFSKVLHARHSTRSFSERPVTRELLEEILLEAGAAPSWINTQEWRVYVATGAVLEKIRKEYVERASYGIQGSSDFPVTRRTSWSPQAQANMSRLMQKAADLNVSKEWDESENALFHAPAAVYLTLPKDANKWAIMDMGGFEQTLLLSATNKGVDSITAYSMVKYPDVIRKYLNVPENYAVAIGIALGYASDSKINTFRSERMTLNQFAKFSE